MSQASEPPDLIIQIESLQDDVLSRLDDLNHRIESTLSQHGAVFPGDAAAGEPAS